MDGGIDNVVIEALKGLRSDMRTLRSEIHAELRDVKLRLAGAVPTQTHTRTVLRRYRSSAASDRDRY